MANVDRKDESSAGVAIVVATESGASAVGAAVGLIGGPIGAIIGAALAPGLSHLGRAGLAWIAARQEAVIGAARDSVGGEDKLIRELEARPDLMSVLVKTMNAAIELEVEGHISALAAVLRDGVLAVIPTNEARRLVDVVAGLTPASVRVLDYVCGPTIEQDGYHVDLTIAKDLGYSRATVRTALRRLEDAEAVSTNGGLLGEGWSAEPTAHQILEYLRSA